MTSTRLILGIVLAVITFWLFAQTTLNVAPTMREELGISESLNNIAVSITFTFLLARQYMIVAFVGFTMFGIGLGFYATPSTDAALSDVPNEKAGAASGIYKMASSLGAVVGVAISAALFTSLSGLSNISASLSDLFLGRTDNVGIRFAASIALLFNVLMVVVALIAIAATVPKDDPRARERR